MGKKLCEDINECQELATSLPANETVCGGASVCTNAPGEYECTCAEGMVGGGVAIDTEPKRVPKCENRTTTTTKIPAPTTEAVVLEDVIGITTAVAAVAVVLVIVLLVVFTARHQHMMATNAAFENGCVASRDEDGRLTTRSMWAVE